MIYEIKKCQFCNKEFEALKSELKRGKAKFCSKSCRYSNDRTDKSYRKKYWAEYKKKYPERHLARQKISDAIRRRKIFKGVCVVCGEEKVEAHHKDYNKPMEIVWLCRKHHREADKKLGLRMGDFQ